MDSSHVIDLMIDNEHSPVLHDNEAAELMSLQKSFIISYLENRDIMNEEEWLNYAIKEHLPEKDSNEIANISSEIIKTINLNDNNKSELEQEISNGRSKESWFASSIKKSTSHLGMQGTTTYLHKLNNAITAANGAMYSTIKNNNLSTNMNNNLDGFIAEQYHVNSFNIEAELKGSEYRAKVIKSEGQAYNKNSVDIVIIDSNGKAVRRYQCKYYKDAGSTLRAFKNGDYRGQRRLVPEGQNVIKSTQVIESPDGITSKPISKNFAKDLQYEAQSGNWKDYNWNEYKTKDLAIGIGKQASYAALQGVAIGVGMEMTSKLWKGEKIKGQEVIKTALVSGADFGIKAATAGALKVGVEKGIIRLIPKGTPAGTIANIAYVAIENVKVLGKMANDELTFKEGIEKIEQTTVAIVAGIAAGAEGAAIGAAIGTVFGPVGTVVGGFIGGTVGYMAGSKFGESVVRIAQKIRNVAINIVKDAVNTTRDTVSNFCSGVKNFAGGVVNLLGF